MEQDTNIENKIIKGRYECRRWYIGNRMSKKVKYGSFVRKTVGSNLIMGVSKINMTKDPGVKYKVILGQSVSV